MRPLLILVVFYLAACATTGERASQGWIEARTENFTLMSELSEEATAELVRELEIFRSAAQLLTNMQKIEPRVPTHIYLFESRVSYGRFSPQIFAGSFTQGMRANHAILVWMGDASTQKTLYHEYTHFLVQNEHALAYPRWYNEGLAEVMGALEIKDGWLEVGNFPVWASERLYSRWIPVEEVLSAEGLDPRNLEKIRMFYAESWALVHYFMFGPGNKNFLSNMSEYLDLISKQHREETALQRAFNMSFDDLDRQLNNYIKEGIPAYKLPIDALVVNDDVTIRPLSPEVVAIRLGDLSLLEGRMKQAESFYQHALSVNPALSRAWVGIGEAYKSQDKWQEAEAAFVNALDHGSEDALVQLDVAEFWHDKANATDDASEKEKLLALARSHYVKSYQIDANIPETYAMYGSTYVGSRETAAQGIDTLEYAHDMLPANPQINLLLGETYIAAGRAEDARSPLQTVLVWFHGGTYNNIARDLLESIDSLEAVTQ